MDFPIFIFFLSFLHFLHHAQSLHFHFDNSTDQDALLSFKSGVTSDPNGILDSWHPNTSFCLWHGVLCNSTKKRVIGLTLGDSSLTGTITSHLTNLSFLQRLDLHNNSFSGEIPAEVHRLFRLKFLDLSFNHIHGTIPSSLSSCLNLGVIDVSHNNIHGTIPSELSYLSKLQYLQLGTNNISGAIPSSFGNLSSLKKLSVVSNNIGGSIPPELGRLRHLESLKLGINNITGAFPTQLLNISSMIKLNIAINKISSRIPSELFTAFPNLTLLYMDGNMLHGFIPSSLSNASNLEDLDLSDNQLSGKIPLFWKLGNIQYLNLEENNLTSEGMDGLDFITSLSNSTLLQTFSVSVNQLTGQLPSSVGNLSSQLYRFYMGANQLHGAIPEEIGNLGSLTMIELESNSFTEKIPSSIGNLINLQSLMLSNNSLSGPIPEALGNLSQLFSLGLEENNLSGGIPSILSNCGRLNYVDLGRNDFIGNIPKEIFSWTSVDYIDISSNKLTGSLPSEIGNLKMLRFLDVSYNRLSGAIPSAIGDCSNLNYMFMSDNSFQGPIPNTLANLRGIEYINLSSNALSGKIPSLDSLKYLLYLDLSANKLRGEVPKTGIFLNTSAIFLSQNTELCGGIAELGLPKCSSSDSDSHSAGRRLFKKLTIAIVVGVVVVGIIIIGLCYYLISYIKRKKQPGSELVADVISYEGPHKLYSHHELKAATGNFGDENLIGKGSFGSVYKGLMRDGTLAAIKVLNMDQHGAIKSFLAECEAFRNIRHRNLVKILSICSGLDFKAFVLQYMPNGSLETWLHKRREDGSRRGLSLKQRIDIAIDVASAMEYLHHACETPVVHCDLKPSNVLLDENMVAHVGDFGLARMLQNHANLSNGQQSSTIGLKGSIGYIAPEYGFGVRVSTKGDVYSYGILLLEMFTEKKPTDEMFSEELNLQRWVATTLPDTVMEIFYKELKESDDIQIIDHLISLLRLGLICASECPEERPEMKEVIVSIKKAHVAFKKNFFNPNFWV